MQPHRTLLGCMLEPEGLEYHFSCGIAHPGSSSGEMRFWLFAQFWSPRERLIHGNIGLTR